jgi:hypothetical protein
MTVYVLQCQQTRNIKIGYTARMVQDRLKELKTAASTPLELVKWYPGLTESHEQQLHATLGQYRVTGEWFKHDALYMVDDAAESLFATGERDFTATCQGKAVSVQTASISISVLKLNGQNLKKSIIDQFPKVNFSQLFDTNNDHATCYFRKTFLPWGIVNLRDGKFVLTEYDGSLFVYNFRSWDEDNAKEFFFKSLYNVYCVQAYSSGALRIRLKNGELRELNDSEEKLFNSYWSLIHSLPQLFLA